MRRHLLLFTGLLVVALPSCATRYQELLTDRDTEIRELKGTIADLQSDKEDLERQLTGEARSAEVEPIAAAGPGVDEAELARVRSELDGVEVRRDQGRLSIGIPSTVTFAAGSLSIRSEARGVLQNVASLLNRDYGDRRIYVQGHTDSDPIRRTRAKFRSNRHLSVERADAVATYLTGQCRVPGAHVVVAGYGSFDPRDQGKSDDAKARNRRVEIVVGEQL